MLGVRVFHGQRAASTYTSDFSPAGLDQLVSSAGIAGENHVGRSGLRAAAAE